MKVNKRWGNLNIFHLLLGLGLALCFIITYPARKEVLEKNEAPPPIIQSFPIVDGPFTAYSNYIVVDSRTGLEWYCRPDSRAQGINDPSAREWVENLSVDGGGWRLPSLEELYGLLGTGSANQGTQFGLQDDWTGNRTPLLWKLESDHFCLNMWIWSGDTIVDIESLFVGSGVSHEIRTTEDGEKLLYFDFNRGRGEDTGPNPFIENVDITLAELLAKTVYAGVFAVR